MGGGDLWIGNFFFKNYYLMDKYLGVMYSQWGLLGPCITSMHRHGDPLKPSFRESCWAEEEKEGREGVPGTHQGGGNLIICDGCWIG